MTETPAPDKIIGVCDSKNPTPCQPEEPVYAFPEIGPDDFGAHHFDKEHSVLWLGIKIDPKLMDYSGAIALLHGYEHVVWQLYAEIVKQIRLRQNLAGKRPE